MTSNTSLNNDSPLTLIEDAYDYEWHHPFSNFAMFMWLVEDAGKTGEEFFLTSKDSLHQAGFKASSAYKNENHELFNTRGGLCTIFTIRIVRRSLAVGLMENNEYVIVDSRAKCVISIPPKHTCSHRCKGDH